MDPTSKISDVPSELWERIFSYLSENRTDVANGRLVCREFHEVGSKFLITRIVIAKQPIALQRAWQILDHPLFRLHVTELVWDASFYHPDLAKDSRTYQEVCSGRITELHRFQRDWRLNYFLSPYDCWVRGGRYSADVVPYLNRLSNQGLVLRQRLHLKTLRECVCRLPRLRWVAYTDFRHLAKTGELDSDLGRRLFGDCLEPERMRFGHSQFEDFLLFLRTLQEELRDSPRARLDGLSIGGRPYEYFDNMRVHGNLDGIPYPFVREFTGDHGDAEEENEDSEDEEGNDASVVDFDTDWKDVLRLRHLKHLHLPVRMPSAQLLDETFASNLRESKSYLRFMLESCESELVSLQISAVTVDCNDVHDSRETTEVHRKVLEALLDGLAFSSLRCLELRYWWLLNDNMLLEFFSRHSSTLREIRLLRCSIPSLQDPSAVSSQVPRNKTLTGIEYHSNGFRGHWRYE